MNKETCRDDLKERRRIFKRIFVCLNIGKKGWKAGCRHIIGFDGCFLRTSSRMNFWGTLGRDGNEQNFPITQACMKSVKKLNLVWFLILLKGELELEDGSQFTFISDMQKV